MKYTNDFEESVANRPFSTYWYYERCYVVKLILDVYYEQCTYFQALQTRVDNILYRIIVFELFGQVYLYTEHLKNGLIESGKLEKIYDMENRIAFVLYCNVENASSSLPMVLYMLENKLLEPIAELQDLFKN